MDESLPVKSTGKNDAKKHMPDCRLVTSHQRFTTSTLTQLQTLGQAQARKNLVGLPHHPPGARADAPPKFRSDALDGGDGCNNLGKLRLERGAAHQEAIDVRLRREIWRICGIRRTAVLDADVRRQVRADGLGKVRTDGGMRLLRLLWDRQRLADAEGAIEALLPH